MKLRMLLMAIALAMPLASSRIARAQMEMPFVPSDHDVRPWEAGRTVTPSGFGEVSGRAALTGNNRLIVVQPRAENQVFIVGSTRFFDAGGNAVASSALTEGAQVKVDFDQRGNTAIARRVTILAPPEPLP